MNDFFEYVKNPTSDIHIETFSFKFFVKTIGLCYFLTFVTSFFIVVLKSNKGLPGYWTPELNSLTFFLAVILIGPLFEEIIFRLNLIISKPGISAFLSVLIIAIFNLIFRPETRIYSYLGVLPIFGLVYFIISRSELPMRQMEIFRKSYFKFLFHLCAITFGMLHLTNYATIYWWMIMISPLLTAPYIALGYILGYIRMKYGFIYGCLIHSTINFISVIFTINKGIVVGLFLTVVVLTSYYLYQGSVEKLNED